MIIKMALKMKRKILKLKIPNDKITNKIANNKNEKLTFFIIIIIISKIIITIIILKKPNITT